MKLTLNPYDDCVGEDEDDETWIRADLASPWWHLLVIPEPEPCCTT